MEGSQTFEEYLEVKKIDSVKFKNSEPKQYQELEVDFQYMHPNSFTAHYLFLINPLRRKYLLNQKTELIKEKPKTMVKPKFKTKK